jgi:hypothetical protein
MRPRLQLPAGQVPWRRVCACSFYDWYSTCCGPFWLVPCKALLLGGLQGSYMYGIS